MHALRQHRASAEVYARVRSAGVQSPWKSAQLGLRTLLQ